LLPAGTAAVGPDRARDTGSVQNRLDLAQAAHAADPRGLGQAGGCLGHSGGRDRTLSHRPGCVHVVSRRPHHLLRPLCDGSLCTGLVRGDAALRVAAGPGTGWRRPGSFRYGFSSALTPRTTDVAASRLLATM